MNRDELMEQLNANLGCNYNWKRLCKLDLDRLVEETNKVRQLYSLARFCHSGKQGNLFRIETEKDLRVLELKEVLQIET
jgi:hypothetical protein